MKIIYIVINPVCFFLWSIVVHFTSRSAFPHIFGLLSYETSIIYAILTTYRRFAARSLRAFFRDRKRRGLKNGLTTSAAAIATAAVCKPKIKNFFIFGSVFWDHSTLPESTDRKSSLPEVELTKLSQFSFRVIGPSKRATKTAALRLLSTR